MKNYLFFCLATLSLACTRPEPAVPAFVPSLQTMQGVWHIDTFSHETKILETQNGETTTSRVVRSFGSGMLLTLSDQRYRFEGEVLFQTVTTNHLGVAETTRELRNFICGETGTIPVNTVVPMAMIADDSNKRFSWMVNAAGPDQAVLTRNITTGEEQSPGQMTEHRESYRMVLSR